MIVSHLKVPVRTGTTETITLDFATGWVEVSAITDFGQVHSTTAPSKSVQ